MNARQASDSISAIQGAVSSDTAVWAKRAPSQQCDWALDTRDRRGGEGGDSCVRSNVSRRTGHTRQRGHETERPRRRTRGHADRGGPNARGQGDGTQPAAAAQTRSTTKAANAACARLDNGGAAGGARRGHKSCDVCVGDTWELSFFVDLESMGAMLHDNFENGHREPRELVHDTYSGVLPVDNRCGFDSFCVLQAAGDKIIDRTPKRGQEFSHLTLIVGSGLANEVLGRFADSQGIVDGINKNCAIRSRKELLARGFRLKTRLFWGTMMKAVRATSYEVSTKNQECVARGDAANRPQACSKKEARNEHAVVGKVCLMRHQRRQRTAETQLWGVGSPTKTFHEGENTVLIDEANGGVGPAAKGGGNIKDTTTLTNQRCGT